MLDRKDYNDYMDLLEKNPDLKTDETLKVGNIILSGVEDNELKYKLVEAFDMINSKARPYIDKNIDEIKKQGDFKNMLRFIGDEVFKEYETFKNLEDNQEKQV